jgi:Ran-binding protein 3
MAVMTGEEDEETVIQVRGKLYTLQDGNQWKERGTGIIRLNVKRHDGSNPRLGMRQLCCRSNSLLNSVSVMRKDAVYTLLLNVTLFPGMRCVLAQDPRYIRFSVIEDGKTTHYNLRVVSLLFLTHFRRLTALSRWRTRRLHKNS